MRLRRELPRRWFLAEDGTYYRNAPLILSELRVASGSHHLRHVEEDLFAELREVRSKGVLRKDSLDKGEVLAIPVTFREAYPDNPGLWVLDEETGR